MDNINYIQGYAYETNYYPATTKKLPFGVKRQVTFGIILKNNEVQKYKFVYESLKDINITNFDFVHFSFEKDISKKKSIKKPIFNIIEIISIDPFHYKKKIGGILKNIFHSENISNKILNSLTETISINEIELAQFLGNEAYQYKINGIKNDLLTNIIDLSKIENFLSQCYTEFIIKILKYLSISMELIEENDMNPVDVIYRCRTNPHTLYFLPTESITNIQEIFGIKESFEDYRLGEVGRFLYKKLQYDKSTYITESQSNKLLDNFEEMYIKRLSKEYFIHKSPYNTICLKPIYKKESYISKKIAELIFDNSFKKKFFDDLNLQIDNKFLTKKSNDLILLEINDIKVQLPNFLTKEQVIAICSSIIYNLNIITGGPGTGKTTIIKELIETYEKNKIPYLICAFVGKAVSNIRSKINSEKIMTIHSSLNSNKIANTSSLRIVIDEFSMVTTDLFLKLIKKFNLCKNITFVGDIDQLPPIYWGELMSQVMKTKLVPTSILNTNYRVNLCDKENYIIKNIHLLKSCNKKKCEFEEGWNFKIYNNSSEEDLFEIIKSYHNANIEELKETSQNSTIENQEIIDENQGNYIYDVNSTTIITPYNKTNIMINKFCQELYNSSNEFLEESNDRKWYIGDRVMMTENIIFENQSIFNGDEGIVKSINSNAGYVEVKFKNISDSLFYWISYKKYKEFSDTKIIVNNMKNVKIKTNKKTNDSDDSILYTRMLTLSYAITVDKSQGSDWNTIIFYVPQNSSNSFVNKRRVYTAISRSKNICIIFGDIDTIKNCSLENSISNTREHVSVIIKDHYEFLTLSNKKFEEDLLKNLP